MISISAFVAEGDDEMEIYMKVVLLAGGAGMRISEESAYRPKPMIEIGGRPILWHIMKEYSYYGFHEFIICAGYKQEYIKEWFADYFLYTSDVTFDYENDGKMTIHKGVTEPWKVTVADTGRKTMTGGRIKRIEPYLNGETFMVTYGDGVCDVNIKDLLAFHKEHGRIATLTSVIRKQEKGVLDISEIGAVRAFREKKNNDGIPINAGYMVFEPAIFNYLKDDTTILEAEPMDRLAASGELMSYRHNGFWQCMDTLLEKNILEKLWEKEKAPWKKW